MNFLSKTNLYVTTLTPTSKLSGKGASSFQPLNILKQLRMFLLKLKHNKINY